MAGAFIYSIEFDTSGDTLNLVANLIFFGVGLKDMSVVQVPILASSSPAEIRQQVTNAVLAEAARLGYSVTATQVILPAFQKGA